MARVCKSDPDGLLDSRDEMRGVIVRQKTTISRLTSGTWGANDQASCSEVKSLEARVDLLEGELRRLRDLVNEEDVAIIDEVLDAS